MRELVETDPEVMELLDSPLMLSIVILAFRDTSPETLRAEGTVEERRGRLWEAYIERMFSRKGKEARYSREQTLRWLLWLAKQMVLRQQTTFFLEQLQHDWLISHSTQRRYTILDRHITGLIYGLLYGLIFAISHGFNFGLSALLYEATNQGLKVGLIIPIFGGVADFRTLQQRNASRIAVDVISGFIASGLVYIVISIYAYWSYCWLFSNTRTT